MTTKPAVLQEEGSSSESPDAREFWSRFRDHQLAFQRCDGCRSVRHPPIPSCPWCGSLDFHLVTSSRKGRVYSWVRVWHAFREEFEADIPYTVVTVTMDEGCRMFGRLVDHGSTDNPMGAYVEAVFVGHGEWTECRFVTVVPEQGVTAP